MSKFTETERNATLALALIFTFRMLGLFMILPVFSFYAQHLPGATPSLIGLSIGIYGLTQACLQIPFGMASDKWGRKPIILLGLLLFATGSLIAASAHSIFTIIFGRALQGAGAIGSTLMALLADLTRVETRTKAMALVGLSIGVAFGCSMIVGPIVAGYYHLSGIFLLTTLLAGSAMLILQFSVPTPCQIQQPLATNSLTTILQRALTHPDLLRLNYGIFCLHFMLTSLFVVIPIILNQQLALVTAKQWLFYLPLMGFSFISMLPLIILAERKRRMRLVFMGCITLMMVSLALLSQYHDHLLPLSGLLFIFFTGFNFMEASLPSLVSKTVSPDHKGTAMGVYSSSQFLGIFAGGITGGWTYGHLGISAVFLLAVITAGSWLLFALWMTDPIPVSHPH